VQKPKSEQIHVKVSDVEKRKFERLAESRHMKLSELVRQILHREADIAKGQAA